MVLGTMGLSPLKNGVLLWKWESDSERSLRRQLLLPRSRIPDALKGFHGNRTEDSFGEAKSLQKARKRMYCKNTREDAGK